MSSPDGAGRPSGAAGRIIWDVVWRRLFRRKKLTQTEVAEQERLNRNAQQARYRAELEMAKQRGYIEGYLDSHPPGGGL
jgi:hypothetical protein